MAETGVYRVYAKNGASFVGFSRNVGATLKRLKFELTLNACSFKPLQRLWNESGPLETEFLEGLDAEGMDELALDAHLKALVLKWLAVLGDSALPVQTEVET